VQGQVGHLLANHAARADRGLPAGYEAKCAFDATMSMEKIDVAAIKVALKLQH
jgi:hypothetical protein